jgi:hypothetical protein
VGDVRRCRGPNEPSSIARPELCIFPFGCGPKVVRALGRAGQKAMEAAKDEHFDKGLLAHGERYGMDLSDYTVAMRKHTRKNKRLSPVCLNSPRLDADA